MNEAVKAVHSSLQSHRKYTWPDLLECTQSNIITWKLHMSYQCHPICKTEATKIWELQPYYKHCTLAELDIDVSGDSIKKLI